MVFDPTLANLAGLQARAAAAPVFTPGVGAGISNLLHLFGVEKRPTYRSEYGVIMAKAEAERQRRAAEVMSRLAAVQGKIGAAHRTGYAPEELWTQDAELRSKAGLYGAKPPPGLKRREWKDVNLQELANHWFRVWKDTGDEEALARYSGIIRKLNPSETHLEIGRGRAHDTSERLGGEQAAEKLEDKKQANRIGLEGVRQENREALAKLNGEINERARAASLDTPEGRVKAEKWRAIEGKVVENRAIAEDTSGKYSPVARAAAMWTADSLLIKGNTDRNEQENKAASNITNMFDGAMMLLEKAPILADVLRNTPGRPYMLLDEGTQAALRALEQVAAPAVMDITGVAGRADEKESMKFRIAPKPGDTEEGVKHAMRNMITTNISVARKAFGNKAANIIQEALFKKFEDTYGEPVGKLPTIGEVKQAFEAGLKGKEGTGPDTITPTAMTVGGQEQVIPDTDRSRGVLNDVMSAGKREGGSRPAPGATTPPTRSPSKVTRRQPDRPLRVSSPRLPEGMTETDVLQLGYEEFGKDIPASEIRTWPPDKIQRYTLWQRIKAKRGQ